MLFSQTVVSSCNYQHDSKDGSASIQGSDFQRKSFLAGKEAGKPRDGKRGLLRITRSLFKMHFPESPSPLISVYPGTCDNPSLLSFHQGRPGPPGVAGPQGEKVRKPEPWGGAQ